MPADHGPRVVLGVDFGATNLKAVLTHQDGAVLESYTVSSRPSEGPEPTLGRITELIERAGRDAQTQGTELRCVGIGVCGPVDHARGRIIESPVLPGWYDVPVLDALRDATGLPTVIDNDANCAILGEWWKGAGRQRPIVAGLTLGTGIGGGLIIGGEVYRGATGLGAEFGHIRVAERPVCPCGGRGCLGRVASATALCETYRTLVGKAADKSINAEAIGRLAREGDGPAGEAIANCAAYLGAAILTLINVLNPNVFVLTGGMAQLGDLLLVPVRATIRSSTFARLGETTQIVTATLGTLSGSFGAARLAAALVDTSV